MVGVKNVRRLGKLVSINCIETGNDSDPPQVGRIPEKEQGIWREKSSTKAADPLPLALSDKEVVIPS